MASASSSVARLFIRDGKSAANLLIRARAASLTDSLTNPVPAIRSLIRFNTTPAYQYPIFSESFPVMQPGFHFEQEATIWNMKAGHGKGVVDTPSGDSEEEIDSDEVEFDFSDDEEFHHLDEDIDDLDEEDDDEEEEEKYTKKNNKK